MDLCCRTRSDADNRKIGTATTVGSYDPIGATLQMDMPDMGEKGRFVLWYEGWDLIMQQFDSRWRLAPVK